MKTTIPNTKTIMTKLVKTIILLLLVVGIFRGINIYQGYMDNKNYVEPYCAVKYEHNVEQYKECKVLTPTKVLQQLKENANVVSEVIDLQPIGM